jgi:hypothetical protein
MKSINQQTHSASCLVPRLRRDSCQPALLRRPRAAKALAEAQAATQRRCRQEFDFVISHRFARKITASLNMTHGAWGIVKCAW